MNTLCYPRGQMKESVRQLVGLEQRMGALDHNHDNVYPYYNLNNQHLL